jgi:hypothetical protein
VSWTITGRIKRAQRTVFIPRHDEAPATTAPESLEHYVAFEKVAIALRAARLKFPNATPLIQWLVLEITGGDKRTPQPG